MFVAKDDGRGGGSRERSLGGAVTHFSVAASFFTDVSVVAVIGDDFTAEDETVFHERRIHIENLERIPGGTTVRWVGTGRTVFDNKGNAVKKYEPFFSATHEYENEKELVEWGVTPILRYDPLGRLIRTDLPNGTFSRVEFTPWRETRWDENDTVLESACGNGVGGL